MKIPRENHDDPPSYPGALSKDLEKVVEDYLFIRLVEEKVAEFKAKYADVLEKEPTRWERFKDGLKENWPFLVAGILVGFFMPILSRVLY